MIEFRYGDGRLAATDRDAIEMINTQERGLHHLARFDRVRRQRVRDLAADRWATRVLWLFGGFLLGGAGGLFS